MSTKQDYEVGSGNVFDDLRVLYPGEALAKAELAHKVSKLIEHRRLCGMGFSVQVNNPYTGGTIVQRYGDPAAGYHTVQIEMKRSLYLNEATVTKADRFDAYKQRLMEGSRRVCDAARELV